ncbi:MAG: CHRD domain-containing protein [Burkholderiales bacterium]|nr:CHRD domain-containing protein [Burkholderiales bacterium]MDE2394132.1 CHRD domain-containing protein [Burkholderiales bacterium]MDE2454590.1 CHRD domain-containing protein [Burkholderiales bacterium]
MRLPNGFISSAALAAVSLALLSGPAAAAGLALSLSGDHEVPPVATAAKGSGTITVGDDGSVSGSIQTTGIAGTMAHIHMAPSKGTNGPVIIPLTQSAPGVWSVPAGAKLSAEQFEAFKAGRLYVNVHSAEHKPGEIRADLQP